MNKNALTKLSYGMYIVSTKDKGRFCGCVANSIMQITSEPSTIALSINCNNHTNQSIKESGEFSVCVLGEDTDPLIIGTFGFRSSKDFDKFENINHKIINNLPVCSDTCAYFLCKLKNSVEAGTHTIFIGEITCCDILNDDTPMTYSYYHNVIKGKSPKNAPTFIG